MYWLYALYILYDEVLLYLQYVDICLGYQNLDFFLQQLQFEHDLVCARCCAEPCIDRHHPLILLCRVLRYYIHFKRWKKVLQILQGKERIWKLIWPIPKPVFFTTLFSGSRKNENLIPRSKQKNNV